MSGQGTFDQYTTIQWIAAVIVAIISFPIGLAVPIYFYIKSNNGTAAEQGAWEAWGVILAGIIGIIAVELGGETGGKIAIAIVVLLPILLIVAAVLGSFALGLGGAAGAGAPVVAAL
ncbi:hypothetical protein [Haloarcula halophila]|uniref:hypothetical protein n=1 Tax=Haloarcula TaxID=2237 RepID=UPI0023E453F3|nr:hypothetical protein [Halomicroarcula sp. DFY41]